MIEKIESRGGVYRNIGFQKGGFGDAIVAFKALYILRKCYPRSNITYICSTFTKPLIEPIKSLGITDRIVVYDSLDEFAKNIKSLHLDVLITNLRSKNDIATLKTLPINKIVAYLHAHNLFSPKFVSPRFLFRGRKRMGECDLKLVERLDTRRYKEVMKNEDFSDFAFKIPPLAKECVESKLESLNYNNFSHIIGVNAFSSNSTYKGYNFEVQDWLDIAIKLAETYPSILFLFLDFEGNSREIPKFSKRENLVIFKNSSDIFSYIELTSRLDMLISVDTSNVHLADIFRIPTFGLYEKDIYYRWRGGSWGGKFSAIRLPKNWKEEYESYKEKFLSAAKESIHRWVCDVNIIRRSNL